jgi:hypothetical protein
MGRTLSVLGLLASLLWLAPAEAVREFPQDALRGTIDSHEYPYYRIDKKTYRMSAGGRIFNEHNLIIVPVSLPGGKVEVMYRLDTRGELFAIWLLTREEAELNPKQSRTPATGGRPR